MAPCGRRAGRRLPLMHTMSRTLVGDTVANEQDIYLFHEGTQANLHRFLGCELLGADSGARFGVWAPNAAAVSVIGDWNGWNRHADPLAARTDGSGVWEGRAPGVRHGQAYKYSIVARDGG